MKRGSTMNKTELIAEVAKKCAETKTVEAAA